jgi:hypothetical protein
MSEAIVAASKSTRALVVVGIGLFAYGHITRKFLHWDCPIRVLTHHACPTCGLTSALRAMMHFHFAAATKIHPLALVVIPFVVVLAAFELGAFVVTGRFGFWSGKTKTKSAVRIAGIAMCAALFAVWVARFFGAFGGPQSV